MRTHSRALITLLEEKHAQDAVFEMAEVGVWRGINAHAVLSLFPNLTLHLVDNGSECDENAQLEEAMERLEVFQDRVRWYFDDSAKVAQRFCDYSFDAVFIDADHSYEGVLSDIDAWYPKVKTGGFISGHDYDGVGDRKGRFGVKRAVDDSFADVRVSMGLVWSYEK